MAPQAGSELQRRASPEKQGSEGAGADAHPEQSESQGLERENKGDEKPAQILSISKGSQRFDFIFFFSS